MIAGEQSESIENTEVNKKGSIFKFIKKKQKFLKFLNTNGLLCDPLTQNFCGDTPFIFSCKFKRWDIALVLLDFYNESCLSNNVFNYCYENSKIVEKLLTYSSLRSQITINLLISLIKIFDQHNCIKVANFFDNETLNENYILNLACKYHLYDFILNLLNRDLEIIKYDTYGYSPIMYIIKDENINASKCCFRMLKGVGVEKGEKNIKIFNEYDFSKPILIKDNYGNKKIKASICNANGKYKILKEFNMTSTIKILSDSFIKEIILINHLNKKYDFVNIDGILIDENYNYNLVFEPLAVTLYDYFKMLKFIPDFEREKEITRLFNDVIKFLTTIHEYGILHNDLKLENIMIDYNGRIKIIDFGLSEFLLFCPSKNLVNHYVTTSHIKAPDNIISKFHVHNLENKIVSSFTNEINRKSYTSDIFSFGVSMFQGIIGKNIKVLSIGNILYEVEEIEKEEKEKKEEKEYNLYPINECDINKLKKLSFYSLIIQYVNIDPNIRIFRPILENSVMTEYHKSSNRIISKSINYSIREIKNFHHELVYSDRIYDNYIDEKLFINPIFNTKYEDKCNEIFKKLVICLKYKTSMDTLFNAMYNTINYSENENPIFVAISYLFIFSYIFEWHHYDIVILSETFDIPSYVLINNVNSLIIKIIPKIRVKPFVIFIKKHIMKMMTDNVEQLEINRVENYLFDSIFQYFCENKKIEVITIKELVDRFI
jgi:serine/threonine protein kinase